VRGNGLFVNRARRRRCLAVVGPLLALTIAGAWQTFAAGAAVSPTGDVRINVNGTLLVTVLGTPGNVPFAGTLDGTVNSAGTLNFAQGDIDFPQTPQITVGASTFQITPEATTDWTGSIDPDTGAVVLDGSLNVVTAGISPAAFPACPVGPSTLHLVSGASGLGLTGTPYDKNNGTAMIVDGGFHTPAVPTSPAPAGCSTFAALVNTALGLPNDTGKTVFQITFEPILGSGTTSTSTTTTTSTSTTTTSTSTTSTSTTTSTTVAPTTTTTTVVPATTTTTVAPTTTTTTVAPTTTTTTVAPTTTTTTTVAPTTTTTTTVAPTTTTTTVASRTTTTTVAPTTTTTEAPTTTTTAPVGVTSTTVAGESSTTTTEPIVCPASDVNACSPGTTIPAAPMTTTTTAVSHSSGSLPFTGGPVMPLVLVGLTLLGTGLGLAVRRRSAV
jgi:hypothetical protein